MDSEREIHAYAIGVNLPIHHDDCPHAPGALRQKHRAYLPKWRPKMLTMHGLRIPWMQFVHYGRPLKPPNLKLGQATGANSVVRLQVNPFVKHVPSSNGWARFN